MSVSTITVDYHNTQHAQDVLTCMAAYAEDAMGGGEPLDEYVKENLITELKKRPFVFSVLCYVDGQVAALANCIEGFSTFSAKPIINFHDVVVLKEFRGQGLTKALFSHVEAIAIKKGCCKLTLEVLEGNVIAKNAYTKEGFASYVLDPEHGQALFWQKKL